MRRTAWTGAAALAALGALGAWSAWSRFRTDHAEPLPHALTGERERLDSPAGSLSFYTAGPSRHWQATAVPLLLIHGVNASASACEMKPIFEHYSNVRPVYALDLPGFGFSERTRRDYTPRLMTDAVLALAAEIRRRHPAAGTGIDAIALSLACEFLARAAVEHPEAFASVGFISPTGFSGSADPRSGEPDGIASPARDAEAGGSARGSRRIAAALDRSLWGQPLFDLLVSRAGIRHFLQRAWGSSQVDPDLIDYGYRTSHRPGARHAPLAFFAARPFSAQPMQIYRNLQLRVWMAHGTRGACSDFRRKAELQARPNWTIDSFDSGALPHFEQVDELLDAYDRFLQGGARTATAPVEPA